MYRQLITILAIESNPQDVNLLRSLLGLRWDGRFELLHAEDLATALEICRNKKIDLILLTLSLSDSQGLATYTHLAAQISDLPVVVLTEQADEQLAMNAVSSGAQDYLVKADLDDQLLVRSIRYSLERAHRTSAEDALRATAARLKVAHEIQQRLFPKTSPNLPGYDIAGISHPAEETGGDLFDYLTLSQYSKPSKRIGIVVADVSSHGLGSSLLMAETRAYIRALCKQYTDVGEILTKANQILVEDTDGSHFVTLFMLSLDPESSTMTYAAAGHAGYLLHQSGEITLLDSTSLPLGVRPQEQVHCGPQYLIEPGDTLLICTDGIQESESPQRKMFGIDQTLKVVQDNKHLPAKEIVHQLYTEARRFAGGKRQEDDITAVVIKKIE